jgi:hypothetical protein
MWTLGVFLIRHNLVTSCFLFLHLSPSRIKHEYGRHGYELQLQLQLYEHEHGLYKHTLHATFLQCLDSLIVRQFRRNLHLPHYPSYH